MKLLPIVIIQGDQERTAYVNPDAINMIKPDGDRMQIHLRDRGTQAVSAKEANKLIAAIEEMKS